jgi:hypothetical protein
MAHTRGTPVTSEEPTIDRRAAFKGALAAAGALDPGAPPQSSANAQAGEALPTTPGATRALTRFLTSTKYSELPRVAVEHAKMSLASTLSSAAVGIAMDSARIQRDLALEQSVVP